MPYNNFARSNSTHEDWKIVDRFDSTYWSGLDAQIYFNNILINEAIQVSYMISEQVRPYYGYASYLPTRVHHGARIVQGELTLNYKRDGYLFSLLQIIREQDTTNIAFGFESGRNLNSSPEVRPPIEYGDTYGEDIWERIKNENFTADTVRSLVDKASQQRIVDEGEVNKESFGVKLTKGAFETRLEGFDINIVFGTNLSGARALRWVGADEYELDPLDASYGDAVVSEDTNLGTRVFGTTSYHHAAGMKIIGASIAGMAKTVNDDGRALLETYSFTARDIAPLTRVDRIGARSKGAGFAGEDYTYKEVNYPSGSLVDTNTKNFQGQIGNTFSIPSEEKNA